MLLSKLHCGSYHIEPFTKLESNATNVMRFGHFLLMRENFTSFQNFYINLRPAHIELEMEQFFRMYNRTDFLNVFLCNILLRFGLLTVPI